MTTPLHPDVMRRLHRHRVELILLGMVLARSGDRDYILKTLFPADLDSELITDCLEAIRTQDKAPLAKAMKQWGVDLVGKKKASHAVVERISKLGAEDRARNLLSGAMQSGNAEEMLEALKSASRTLGETNGTEERLSEFGYDQQE